MARIVKGYAGVVTVLAAPIVLSGYFRRDTGREHGVGLLRKLRMLVRFIVNTQRLPTESNFLEHVAMATEILRVPKDAEGVVVECGCYKGGSTANLSIACAAAGRKLHVFDSFEGIPAPEAGDEAHGLIATGELHTYEQGAFSAGGVETVRRNVARGGKVDVCEFHEGYFDQTLPHFSDKVVFAFVDVDLKASLEPCLQYVWPLLRDDSYFFTHEARHMEIAESFFDRDWWRSEVGSEPPGLVGAGTGIGLATRSGPFGSNLGYAVKLPSVGRFADTPQVGR